MLSLMMTILLHLILSESGYRIVLHLDDECVLTWPSQRGSFFYNKKRNSPAAPACHAMHRSTSAYLSAHTVSAHTKLQFLIYIISSNVYMPHWVITILVFINSIVQLFIHTSTLGPFQRCENAHFPPYKQIISPDTPHHFTYSLPAFCISHI